jgi:molybdopterin converting factor small subunit
MRVKLLYFGVLRERFGASDEVVELADGIAVGELLRVLRGRTSNDAMSDNAEAGLDERLWRSIAVAVNREYSLLDVVLRDGDEVALLPPVSGGCCAEGGTARTPKRLASLASALRAAGIAQDDLWTSSPC